MKETVGTKEPTVFLWVKKYKKNFIRKQRRRFYGTGKIFSERTGNPAEMV
jgi:hypothetical protein